MGKKRRTRAPNNSGSIWKRPDGRWGVALTVPYYDPETGRTKRKPRGTTKTSWEAAHRWLMTKQSELLGGAILSPEDPTLSGFLDTWLADVVEPGVSRNTYLKRRWAANNHLSPALGHFRLSELEPRAVQALYSRLSREYSLATRREIHVALKMALSQAVKWGLTRRNPLDVVDPPKADRRAREEEDEGEIRALTDGQARELFRASGNSRWRNYFVAAVRTGLRPGELLGLRWGDLNLGADPGSLRVRRTLDTHSQPTFNPPKSAASRRTVALHWEAQDALVGQKAMLEGEGLPTGPKALVFPSESGTPMNAGNLRKRHLHRYLKEAGLPRLSLHELRHSFASIMLHEWQVAPDVVRQMMGHRSLRETMGIYGHLMPTAQADVIRSLARMHRKAG